MVFNRNHLGGRFRRLFCSGGVNLPLPFCLKLVRTMLETYNLVRKYTRSTHISRFRKCSKFSTKIPLILLMSPFLCKMSTFFGKNSTFTQSNTIKLCQRCFSSVFSFCKNPAFGLLQIVHKLRKWQLQHKMPGLQLLACLNY